MAAKKPAMPMKGMIPKGMPTKGKCPKCGMPMAKCKCK